MDRSDTVFCLIPTIYEVQLYENYAKLILQTPTLL